MELQEDILVEILSRIGVKQLLRFKLVCKAWNVLIQSPWFANLHLKHGPPPKNHMLLLNYPSTATAELQVQATDDDGVIDVKFTGELITLDLRQDARLVGCCNGLICVAFRNKGKLVTRNLLTGLSHEFSPTSTCKFCKKAGGGMVNDALVMAYGFGYASSTNEYKVIRLLKGEAGAGLETQVCSLKTAATSCCSSWKRVHQHQHHVSLEDLKSATFYNRQPVLLNDVLHWFGPDIYTFNLAEEQWGKIPTFGGQSAWGIGVLGGYLVELDNRLFENEVWMMLYKQDHGGLAVESSWTKLLSFQNPIIMTEECEGLDILPLNILSDGKIWMGIFEPWGSGDLAVFDMIDNTYLPIGGVRVPWTTVELVNYMESLVPPH